MSLLDQSLAYSRALGMHSFIERVLLARRDRRKAEPVPCHRAAIRTATPTERHRPATPVPL